MLACWIAIFAALVQTPAHPAPKGARQEPRETEFVWPCDRYRKGLRGKGNFGLLVHGDRRSPFAGTYHLAEDVWLAGGTEVRSVADGRVKYSDFSPTWTDENGRKHWNLGNVIVIEHDLDPHEDGLAQVCSFYVHLSKDRKVKVGDRVKRGQLIGYIGADRSEENGRYPAHLHFGLHRGPYRQISPSWKRTTIAEAKKFGLPTVTGADGKPQFTKGKIVKVELSSKDTAAFRFESGAVSYMSLLIGSTSPGYKPADIMHWCEGYGDKRTVADWIRPSTWIAAHRPDQVPRKRAAGRRR